MNLLRNILLLVFLLIPLQSFGQLSSESYQVIGHSIGSTQGSLTASSTSYSVVSESGGLYTFTPSVGTVDAQSSAGFRRQAVPVDSSVSTALYTPSKTVQQGVTVTIFLDLKTINTNSPVLGADAYILVSGSNETQVKAYELGNGLYRAEYTAHNSGFDRIMAKIQGVTIDATENASLFIQVLGSQLSTIPDTPNDFISPGTVSNPNSDSDSDSELNEITEQTNNPILQHTQPDALPNTDTYIDPVTSKTTRRSLFLETPIQVWLSVPLAGFLIWFFFVLRRRLKDM